VHLVRQSLSHVPWSQRKLVATELRRSTGRRPRRPRRRRSRPLPRARTALSPRRSSRSGAASGIICGRPLPTRR
jgi:hypothetical protein